MGKYGSGSGIKNAIEQEEQKVQSILWRSSLSKDEQEEIMSSFREIVFEWCNSNATACAMDKYLKELFPEEYKEFLRTFLTSSTYNGTYLKKMEETCPYMGR